MQKSSTLRTSGKNSFRGQLTIRLDLGDRCSSYCVLDEAGEILLEQKVATTPEAMQPRTPHWHRAKIAQPRVRMEGWRQRRLRLYGKVRETRGSYSPLTRTGLLMEGLDRLVCQIACVIRSVTYKLKQEEF